MCLFRGCSSGLLLQVVQASDGSSKGSGKRSRKRRPQPEAQSQRHASGQRGGSPSGDTATVGGVEGWCLGAGLGAHGGASFWWYFPTRIPVLGVPVWVGKFSRHRQVFWLALPSYHNYLVNNWYFNYSNTFRITGEMCVFQLSTAINGQEYGICLLPGLWSCNQTILRAKGF